MNKFALLLLLLVHIAHSVASEDGEIRLLTPEGSAVSMMCDPLAEGRLVKANWIKDNALLGSATGQTNLRLIRDGKSRAEDDDMPLVGLLILDHVRRGDAGRYWCESRSNGTLTKGRHTLLQVAYMDQFGDAPITVTSDRDQLVFHCQPPNAFPPPAISWHRLPETGWSRMTDGEEGELRLAKSLAAVEKSRLVCTASNSAGRRHTQLPQTIDRYAQTSLSAVGAESWASRLQTQMLGQLVWLTTAVALLCTLLILTLATISAVQMLLAKRQSASRVHPNNMTRFSRLA